MSRRHGNHKGLIGGIVASGGLLGLSYWLTGLFRLRGLARAVTVPVLAVLILSVFMSFFRGH